MFRSKSPARGPSPRPTAQQDTKLLHALFMAEEHKQTERRLSASGRRPSASTPSQSEPVAHNTSTSASLSPEHAKTQQVSQDGNVHVVGQDQGRLQSGTTSG
ncbi:hypothetical protein WAI453_001462 [Rhynchosporium graminicola]|uniref:Uncharacterized protein n=2 Tax=Rhynchosporium TaxID=38037 RepID=A0A1E1MRS1_RHYSE|nr:uncharacterized protein RCO7_09872 [Rhynchosporium commune]CZT51789.1 uncharacterized protein RSE6_12985 [Rhynchosporium secalis]